MFFAQLRSGLLSRAFQAKSLTEELQTAATTSNHQLREVLVPQPRTSPQDGGMVGKADL